MDNLRQLLETAKGDGPPPRYEVDDIVAAGRRRQRRTVVQRVGGAGLAVAAGIVGTVLVISNLAPAQPPTSPKVELPNVVIPPLTFAFESYSSGAFTVLRPQQVTTTNQVADVTTQYGGETAHVGTLTVFRPGVQPPPEATTGTKVTVNGRPGFASTHRQYLNFFDGQTGEITGHINIDVARLGWQYADGGWAVLDGPVEQAGQADLRMKASDELALAENFQLGTQTRARMPFQTSYLPAGFGVSSVNGRSLGDEDIGSVTIVFAPKSGDGVEIYIGRQQSSGPPDAPKKKETCGRFVDDVLSCSWNIPNTKFFLLLNDRGNTLSSDELIRIGQGLTFDNLDKPETWHPVP